MTLSLFADAARSHVAKLDALVEKGSVTTLRRMYAAATADLERKLVRALGSGASPFTVHQHQVLLAQARQGMSRLSSAMGIELNAQSRVVQQASMRQAIASIKQMEKLTGAPAAQLPIEQAARFMGVVDRRKTSLLKLNQSSMARYGASTVTRVEGALSQSLLTGETGHKAIDRVADAMDGEWWRAERIVRTETAGAYNATQVDAVAATAEVFPDIMTRWTEMVADVTLTKLDSRVGDDSCAMHGQLARPGGMFGMPSDNPGFLNVSESLIGQSWSSPPNRPNDRAVLQPWRPGWGWGWILVAGGRGPAPAAPHRRR